MKVQSSLNLVLLCVFLSAQSHASLPESLDLNGTMYYKAAEDAFGNEKSANYLPKDQTLSNWDSMATIWHYLSSDEPLKLAENKFGLETTTELIGGDSNNILVYFNSYNSIGKAGDPVTFQQNVWRLQKLNYNKGIIALAYAQRKLLPNQTSPNQSNPIDSGIVSSISALPLQRYSF